MTKLPIYADCNATTPIEPEVADLLMGWFAKEIGNSGSRTHEFGNRAKKSVDNARGQIAQVVQADEDEVIFTSGATESNNLAILGLIKHGESVNKRHIISTAIEHKAVLEPLEVLRENGFTITLIESDSTGLIDPNSIIDAIRPDTLLISMMHVNNETGVRQPIDTLGSLLKEHDAYFHVDAAQGFGRDLKGLADSRIDFISVSSHKIYGPVGIGALIARKRGYKRPPLRSLIFGGGQERGLRPGTLPVPLIIAFGRAAELAFKNSEQRIKTCQKIRESALKVLTPLGISINGASDCVLPHVLNFSVDGVDSEALMLATKDLIAISNGSACTSQSYEPSHVLTAMGLSKERISGAIRISWCHLTPEIDWNEFANRILALK